MSKYITDLIEALKKSSQNENCDVLEDALLDFSLSDEFLDNEDYRCTFLNLILDTINDTLNSDGHCIDIYLNFFISRFNRYLQPSHHERLRYIIEYNFGHTNNQSALLYMAEYFGFYGNDWSLDVIDKWLSSSSSGEVINGLFEAFTSFKEAEVHTQHTEEQKQRFELLFNRWKILSNKPSMKI